MAEVKRDQLLNCALCPNMCRCECPVTQAWGREAVSPAGKARLAHMLLEEKIAWSEELLEALSACTGCRGCMSLCPFPELDLAEELLNARQGAAHCGVSLQNTIPYLNNLKKYGSPYGSEKGSATRGSQNPEVLFFVGCTAQANNPGLVQTALALFEKAGVACATIEEFCCGYPAEVWGDTDLARQLAESNLERMANSGAATLVTGCPECWHTFTHSYDQWGLKLPMPVVDSTSYFLKLIQEGRLKPRRVEGLETAVYHDPCLFSRVEKMWREPRELLNKIPGLTLVEAPNAGEKTRCCGGGMMAQLTFPSLAAEMAKRRQKELPSAGAVVTACPFCRESLQLGGKETLELVELLGKACLD